MRILITAGGTREYIDPVRFISNASSGKMGYALARAAVKAGHNTILITAPATQKIPKGLKIIKVETAAEMLQAVKNNFEKCDCLIMAAAVADYTPAKPSGIKIKKYDKNLTIELRPTIDILKWAGHHKKWTKKKKQIVAGFALEQKNLRAEAEKKFKDKNLDMIIANSPKAIAAEVTTIQIKTSKDNWIKIENTNKTVIAKKIINLVENLYKTKASVT
jgi:phosphopantothenoylcysteine decarboxylase/phosphopantothenate--cysteine ligase